MQSGKIITISVWLMITFNLILAFGAVWSFQRMTPELQRVYERNVISLEACEDMFLALTCEKVNTGEFHKALTAAENNITEQGEKETLARIRAALPQLENGNYKTRESIAGDIRELSHYNRQAIILSAEKTQRMRQAGAWGIVFLTFFFFIAAIFFEQRLRRTILRPLKEIDSVLEAQRQGDRFRRCNDTSASSDMKKIFRSINALLDSRDRNK